MFEGLAGMRLVDLARVAGSAEVLRLRLMMKRQVNRVIFAVVALVFVAWMVAMLEASAVVALEPHFGLLYSLLMVAGGNLVVGAILLFLASRDAPSTSETQALDMRRQALVSMRSAGLIMAALQGAWRLARRSR
jgi:hypothetical protein